MSGSTSHTNKKKKKDGFPLGFVNEPRAGLIVLGAAVTVSVEYAASVAQAHVDAVAASLQRLPILRNPQAELLLLRSCLGTCKVVFTARTMPPAAAAQALVTFDMLQTQVLQSIVTAGGGGFGPLQQTLAGLPIAQGGLGVTKATSLLPCAYLASVTQTAPLQDRLLGTSTAPLVPAALAAKADYCALVPDFDAALFEDPDFVRSKVQARLSKPLSHRAYREVLDDPARLDRDRAVLQSLTQPGASDWLLALPVPHLQQTMPPASFRCRLQYQLLIPIFHPGSQCPCCLRDLDVWGDHAVHCTSGGDVAIVGRHYSVRNGLDAVLTSARQRVTREPAFPTPVPGQERRRADLRLHAWEEGRDLYIDIVGSSPLTVANLLHFVPGGAAARAAQDKQTRYAVLLSRQQPPVAFQAFAFETLGGLHADALALLQRLQGLLNQSIIAQEDVEGYFVIRRVSFIIAAAVGRQLAARRHLDGFPLGFVNETRAGLIVLGAAVTVSVEYAASVAQAHVDAVAASLQRLPILRHPQAELLLLRSCLGTCKVVFTARTMPPAAAAQALVTFDMLQTQVLQSIVTAGGGGFGPLQQTLAVLPIAQGGLGVTKATSLLPCAYLASVTQTAPLQDRLLGTSTAPLVPAALAAKADYCALVPDFDAALFEDPDFVRSKVQARLSKPLSHRAYQEVLDDPARSDRDRAVLQSLTQPGASDWLLALPVPHLQQTMPPESFRCRLQYQLLIPIFHPGSQCPCCLRELDVWGDHAVHCTSGGDVAIVGRHYSVRNGLDAVLTSARQRVTRDPAFPTPVPGQERRRADLRLHAWEEGRDLYIDIVGSSPLTFANLLHFVPGGAAARAAQDKQTRYAVLLSRQQPPVAFQAFAFETLGGLHADALALLQRLQGLLNQAIIAPEDVEGYFVIRRVSFIIAAAVGRQLAARRV
eukprot:jgi/Botrbrau1/17419/Bobra.0054s0015.1